MKQVYGVVLAVLLLANAIQAEPMPIELRVNISNDRDLVRRQALGAPFYGPAGGCCPGCPCCPGCMAAPPPVPPPVPAYAPPPLAPLPVPAPIPAFGPCGPACAPPPVPALAPLPPPPIPAVPAPAGRLIPQALPGAPCEPDNVECTGGSVCSLGICLCPPELVQEGTVCVSRTIYGVVPGVPPPPPPPPIAPAAIPVAYPPAVPVPAALPPRPAFFDPCIIKRSAEESAKFGCRNQQ